MALLYRVVTRFTGPPGAPYFNTTYWDDLALSDASNAAGQVAAWWSEIAPGLRDDMDIAIEPEVAHVESTTGEVIGVSVVSAAVTQPTNTADPLPLASQGLMRLRTGSYTGGRELRGRMFIPGMTEGQTTDGRLTTATVDSLNASAAAELVVPGLVVYSPTHHVFAAVTAGSMWQDLAILRSRRD